MVRDTSNSAYRYNLMRDEWTNLPPLNQSRRSHSSSFVQRDLYVIGGYCVRDSQMLGTIERLSTELTSKGWQLLDVQIPKRIVPAVSAISPY